MAGAPREKLSNDDARKDLSSLDLFLSGSFSGALAKTVTAPVDRVKILYQVNPSRQFTMRAAAKTTLTILSNTGVLGLWRGNSSAIIRVIPYAGIQFVTFDKYYQFNITFIDSPVLARLLAGAAAGGTAATMTYPLDVVRARMAAHWNVQAKYHGNIQPFLDIFHAEGSRGLFAGLSPTLLGIIPYAGLSFATYETIKGHLRTVYGNDKEIPNILRLSAGAFAGFVSQTATYPLHVIRRRMQVQGMSTPPSINSPPRHTDATISSPSSSSPSSSPSSSSSSSSSSSLSTFLSQIETTFPGFTKTTTTTTNKSSSSSSSSPSPSPSLSLSAVQFLLDGPVHFPDEILARIFIVPPSPSNDPQLSMLWNERRAGWAQVEEENAPLFSVDEYGGFQNSTEDRHCYSKKCAGKRRRLMAIAMAPKSYVTMMCDVCGEVRLLPVRDRSFDDIEDSEIGGVKDRIIGICNGRHELCAHALLFIDVCIDMSLTVTEQVKDSNKRRNKKNNGNIKMKMKKKSPKKTQRSRRKAKANAKLTATTSSSSFSSASSSSSLPPPPLPAQFTVLIARRRKRGSPRTHKLEVDFIFFPTPEVRVRCVKIEAEEEDDDDDEDDDNGGGTDDDEDDAKKKKKEKEKEERDQQKARNAMEDVKSDELERLILSYLASLSSSSSSSSSTTTSTTTTTITTPLSLPSSPSSLSSSFSITRATGALRQKVSQLLRCPKSSWEDITFFPNDPISFHKQIARDRSPRSPSPDEEEDNDHQA